MPTSRKYHREVRERAVRLEFEHEQDCESQWAAIRSIAEKSGMTSETLRKWCARRSVTQAVVPVCRPRNATGCATSRKRSRSYAAPTRSSKPLRLSSGRS
jgi:transposase-like protein